MVDLQCEWKEEENAEHGLKKLDEGEGKEEVT